MESKLVYNAHTREAVEMMIESCTYDGDDFEGITNITQLRAYIRDELEWNTYDDDEYIADLEDVNWDKVFRTMLEYRNKLQCDGCEEIMDRCDITLHERTYRADVCLCDVCADALALNHTDCMTCVRAQMKKAKERAGIFKEELVSQALHPRRVEKWVAVFGTDWDEYM